MPTDPSGKNILEEVFDDILHPQPVVVGPANEKLSYNLDLALDRQREVLAQPITPETPPRDRRLIADVAHQVVRTAVSVDEHRLKKSHDDNKLAALMQRMWAVKKQLELEGHIIPS